MQLTDLPPHLLLFLMDFLPPSSILQCRASGVTLHELVSDHTGDSALWLNRLLGLAERFTAVSEFASTAVDWTQPQTLGCTSHRQSFFWAERVLPLLGKWGWSREPHGGVLRIQFRGAEVVAVLTTDRIHFGISHLTYVACPLMKLCRVTEQPPTSEGVLALPQPALSRLALIPLGNDSNVRVGIEYGASGDDLEGGVKRDLLTLTHNGRRVSEPFYRVVPMYFQDIALRNEMSELEEQIPGVFVGHYGHGYELINVEWAGTAENRVLNGLKLTGDPNVPATKLTFEGTTNVQPPPRHPPACNCMFGCECFTARELSDITLLGSMSARAKTAFTGYQNPTWNNASLLFYTRNSAASTVIGNGGLGGSAGAVSILLQFNGAQFIRSLRLMKFDFRRVPDFALAE